MLNPPSDKTSILQDDYVSAIAEYTRASCIAS